MSTDKDTVPIDELAQWIDVYRGARAEADKWGELADRARERITEALGEAEIGTIGGKPAVRHTIVQRSQLRSAKLRAEYPEICDAFTVSTTQRRFTLVDNDKDKDAPHD
jgi:predicted phage-related endonuclease